MPIVFLKIVCLTLLSALLSASAIAQAATDASPQRQRVYADSWAGMEAQFADLLQISRIHDQRAYDEALGALGIPDSDTWIAAHFTPEETPALQKSYRGSLEKFKSHVSWAMGSFWKYPDFALMVKDSLTPSPHSNIGFEGLLPSPVDAVKVENFRFTSTSSNPEHGPPSWVSSFTYIDGRFRMVGGTYPFWGEALNALSGQMSIPPAVIHGRTVQGAAFRNDSKGPGIDGIVHLKIEVGHDGKVKHMKVLSGDAEFLADAQAYVNSAEFAKMPDDPRLAGMKAVWDMEVVFFAPKLLSLSPKS